MLNDRLGLARVLLLGQDNDTIWEVYLRKTFFRRLPGYTKPMEAATHYSIAGINTDSGEDTLVIVTPETIRILESEK